MKLCLSCMKKIPLLAGRCPHCLDENQGVHGRIILIILLFVALFIGGKCYLNSLEKETESKQELIKHLEDVGVR
jgi:hypothetical protein